MVKEYAHGLRLAQEEQKERIASFKVAAFLSPLPGIANTHGGIARELREMGVEVRALTSDQAIVSTAFSQSLPFPIQDMYADVDWLFVSSYRKDDIEQIRLFKEKNTKLRIGYIEQTEGDAIRNNVSLMDQMTTPDLIFTVSNDSLKSIMQAMPDYVGMMYPIGNAEFDNLLTLTMPENRTKVHSLLGIKVDDLIVSYVGRPPGAIYGSTTIETRKDVNTDVFIELFTSLSILANEHPDRTFRFLNLSHPAEKELEYIEHLREGIASLRPPSNISLVNMPQSIQQSLGVTALEICAASDLVTTIRSSLGVQTSLLGVLDNSTTTPLTLHVLLRDHAEYLEPEAHPDKMQVLQYQAAPYVQELENLPQSLREALFNKELKRVVFDNQKKFARIYHFGEKSVAKRAAFTVDLYNQHPLLLSKFHQTAFANL